MFPSKQCCKGPIDLNALFLGNQYASVKSSAFDLDDESQETQTHFD
jgi:hypothetical protein